MATQKRPSKGILKSSSSFDKGGETDGLSASRKREMKWDEMNILATYHPEDKDYGHKKIDEPPTPYSYMQDMDDDDGEELTEGGGASKQRRRSKDKGVASIDPQALADRLEEDGPNKKLENIESDSEEEELVETEEERATRLAFESKRKKHYNEFEAVKLAKQLMAEEDEDETYDDDITAQDIVVVENNEDSQGNTTQSMQVDSNT